MKQRTVGLFICLYSGYMMITYIRKSVSIVSPAVIRTEGITESQFGFILSSQMVGYTVGKLLGGVLVDMYSPSKTFVSCLLLAAVTMVAFTACDTVALFALCWFINGLTQGPSWPACALLIKRWFPPETFGTWWSVMSTSMNVSGTAGPLLSAFLLTHYSWHFPLHLAGTFTIGVAIMGMFFLADKPKDSSDASSDCHTNATKPAACGDGVSWRRGVLDLLKQPVFLAVCVNYMLVSLVRGASTDWGHLYLINEKHHSHFTGSSFISSQELGGIVGAVVAGYASDFLISKKIGIYHPRLLVVFGCTVIQSASIFVFLAVSDTSSKFLICLIGFCLGFGVYGCIALFGVIAMESAADRLAGTAHSIVCLTACVGMVLSGFPLSLIAKEYSWHFTFFLVQLVAIVTTMIAVFCVHWSARATSVKQHKN